MRTEKKDTGIFVQTRIKAQGWQECRDFLTAQAKRSIEIELKDWEDEAIRVLHRNGIDRFPRELPDSAALPAKDARELIYAIMGTRDYIKCNDARNAALCAFSAGHIATRMGTRPFEKPAKAGRASPKNLEKGRKSKADRHKKQHEQHKLWLNMANEKADSFESKRSLAFHIANKLHANPLTVYSVLLRKK